MTLKVLVDGDPIFLNMKRLPNLFSQLVDHDVYVFDNAGFSYWFEKEASAKGAPVTLLVFEDVKKLSENRQDAMRRFVKEQKVDELWFITSQPVDVTKYDVMLRNGASVRILNHEFELVDTLVLGMVDG